MWGLIGSPYCEAFQRGCDSLGNLLRKRLWRHREEGRFSLSSILGGSLVSFIFCNRIYVFLLFYQGSLSFCLLLKYCFFYIK